VKCIMLPRKQRRKMLREMMEMIKHIIVGGDEDEEDLRLQ